MVPSADAVSFADDQDTERDGGAAVDGACTGTVVAVHEVGQATVTVPAMGAVGIDANAMATVAMETVTASTSLSYKYDLGGSWDNVEETADCGLERAFGTWP